MEDDWESPTLGAWGLGWEVWLNGMEVTQFTYFQQVGGIDLKPVSVEITYGLERISMYLQEKESVYDLQWNDEITYGHVFHQNEVEMSKYNFELSDADMLFDLFNKFEAECLKLCEEGLPWPAYDCSASSVPTPSTCWTPGGPSPSPSGPPTSDGFATWPPKSPGSTRISARRWATPDAEEIRRSE